jgi:hypothetical protein
VLSIKRLKATYSIARMVLSIIILKKCMELVDSDAKFVNVWRIKTLWDLLEEKFRRKVLYTSL